MQIAAEKFNNHSRTHKLILHFRDSGRGPLLTASAAEELIKEKKVKVLIGMETWQEAALVADVGNQAQVPVISFAAPTITSPAMQLRWPYFIRMGSDGSAQMKCIADIVSVYNWKRVVAIYEDDGYGGDLGMLALLSEALRDVGSKIEHRLVLPRVSSLSNTNWEELAELLKLPSIQSRVFIVLQSSLQTFTHLFRVAKTMGLVGRDSAWIITESITSMLESLDNSDLSTFKGTLGIKTYYAKKTSSYAKFEKEFRTKYLEEDNSTPGIYALRAYDSIRIFTQAISRMTTNSTTSLPMLSTVLRNYRGLSGKMRFEGRQMLHSPIFRITNIVDEKGYKELDFWTPEVGFSENLVKGTGKNRSGDDVGRVIWPGNLRHAPKGWAMPTSEKPMRIGVPGQTSFSKFVKVDWSRKNSDEKKYEGFCIEIFKTVRKRLEYSLPYQFEALNGSYDALVELVHNKTYDAVIGDMTILADRLDKVDFTQPYIESGLVMIAPEKYEDIEWMFMKPLTWQMWMVTGAILIYTTLTVLFLERPTNPEFSGRPWKDQIGTATWFTFTSIFLSQTGRISNNLTRVVVVVWLFLVLILTSSYTASLSSMLTIKRLEPNVTDIEMLKSTNSKVGCDGDSFVIKYLQDVLKFKSENIVKVDSEYNYPKEFKPHSITAAFLELPYAKVYINEFCKGYTATTASYGFGGIGFIFQKGSPIGRDFTKAILELLENGELKSLENSWLTPKHECLINATSGGPESLNLKSFSGLYVISGVTSTICLLLSLTILLKKLQQRQEADQGNASPRPSDESLWNKTVRIARFFCTAELNVPSRAPTSAETELGSSSRWENTSTSTAPEHLQAIMPIEIEGSPHST